jgi:hypothetical protein
MSLPLPVGKFWVSTLTMPVARGSDEWYGKWWIYDCRPDDGLDHVPLAEGSTGAFAEERDADRSAKMAGRRRALALAT